jgi:hypothetical protein
MGHSADGKALYGLSHRHLFEFEASVAPELTIHREPSGARLAICYFTGGWFAGERMRGRLLPGGGDWASFESPHILRIDVRGVLETDDGEQISMSYRGLWRTISGLLPRVLSNQVPYRHEEHYLRVTAQFETGSPEYCWLNHVVVVGAGGYTAGGGVHYSFFELT